MDFCCLLLFFVVLFHSCISTGEPFILSGEGCALSSSLDYYFFFLVLFWFMQSRK